MSVFMIIMKAQDLFRIPNVIPMRYLSHEIIITTLTTNVRKEKESNMVARNLRRDKYCGECNKFLYEDACGYGICKQNDDVCYCGDLCHLIHGKP